MVMEGFGGDEWEQIVDAGGATNYCGQLATELVVVTATPRPRLAVERRESMVELSWPGEAGCFQIEAALATVARGRVVRFAS